MIYEIHLINSVNKLKHLNYIVLEKKINLLIKNKILKLLTSSIFQFASQN